MPEASQPAPESYTPRHLAERILASASALEGERKQVTVLFADLKGSTELIQGLDPEDAQRLLDGAVKTMMEAVHRYEGTVNHVLGDGIMALFGAPIAHEDHAVRACYAALALQEGVRRYSEDVRQRHGVELHARVGLNSGEVVVRSIANDLRMDYSAMGPTVHLASRMEQLAREGTIRLTPATLALAEAYVQVQPLGPVPVRGLPEPVEVFELLGAGGVRTRLQAMAARGLTRFVGRGSELETVYAALANAAASRGQIVALVGEPGVGKSRLVWEVTHSHRVADWTVLESGSVSYGKATAYLPVIDLLKSYCRIEARDDPRTIREKVTGKLLSLDRALESSLSAFLSLLDLPVEDAAWQVLEPPQRRRATLDGVRHLLLRESREQPLLLVFEDLHWIDSETQALLDSLVESLPTSRILLLTDYRPEYSHRWSGKTYYAQLRIDPLPAESADELLAALLGDGASVGAALRDRREGQDRDRGQARGPAPTRDGPQDELKRLLIERTEGNPLFLEESVRTLVETGSLVGERGAYRLAQPISTVRVPATVQAVLAARIDRLPPNDKRLLQTAAVIGKDVPYSLLQVVAGLEQDSLRAGLADLQAAELLYETSLFPDLEYTFKHALTHEVAYGSLLQERRRALHARIVQALETLNSDRLDEQVEQLAHHAMRGELWDQALAYGRRAANKALARSAYREGMTAFEQALSALRQLPERGDTRETKIDLHIRLAKTYQVLGDLDRNLSHLQEAERSAEALDDNRRLCQVLADTSQFRWVIGDQDQAIALATRALGIADSLGEFDLWVTGTYYLGAFYHTVGDYLKAREHLDRVIAALQDKPLWRRDWSGGGGLTSLTSRHYLIWGLADQGDFAQGLMWADEAGRIANLASSAYERILAAHALGILNLRKGDVAGALDALAFALDLCRTSEVQFWFPRVGAALGYGYALAGRLDEALSLLEAAVEQAEQAGNMVFQPFRVVCLAEAYLLADRLDDAQATAVRALDLARTHRERPHEGWGHRLLGEIARQRTPPDIDVAESSYQEALALAEELGMRPLQAHCHLGLGKLFRRMGRVDEARAELSTAVQMLRGMEMTFWLPEAEAELARVATHKTAPTAQSPPSPPPPPSPPAARTRDQSPPAGCGG